MATIKSLRRASTTGQPVGGGSVVEPTGVRLRVRDIIRRAYLYDRTNTSQALPFNESVFEADGGWNWLEPKYLMDPPLWPGAGAPMTLSNVTFRNSAGRVYRVGVNTGGKAQLVGFTGSGTAVFGNAEPTHTDSKWRLDSNSNQIIALQGATKLPATDIDQPAYFVPGRTGATIAQTYTPSFTNNRLSGLLATLINWESGLPNTSQYGIAAEFLGGVGKMNDDALSFVGAKPCVVARFKCATRYVRWDFSLTGRVGVMCRINGKWVLPGPIFSDVYTGAPNEAGVVRNSVELDLGAGYNVNRTRVYEFFFFGSPTRISALSVDAGSSSIPQPVSGFLNRPTTQPLGIAVFGSSYEAGANGSADAMTWPDFVGQALGSMSIDKYANGGCGFVSSGNPTGASLRVADQISENVRLNRIPLPSYDVVFLAGLINDGADYAAVRGGVELAYQRARAAPQFANALLVFVGCLFPAGVDDTYVNTVNGSEVAMRDAVAGINDPNVIFVPVVTDEPPWLTGNGGTEGAGLPVGTSNFVIGGMINEITHPSWFGQSYISRRVLRSLLDRL